MQRTFFNVHHAHKIPHAGKYAEVSGSIVLIRVCYEYNVCGFGNLFVTTPFIMYTGPSLVLFNFFLCMFQGTAWMKPLRQNYTELHSKDRSTGKIN